MPTLDDRLKQITLKVERAKKHASDLDGEIRAFLNTNPYKVAIKRDPDTRKPIHYVASVEPTPECLPMIAGDANQNLRVALDHLAYQIVCSDTGDHPPKPNGIYFPILESAKKYEAEKQGKMQGALKATFDAIDTIKPYKGGNDRLWALHQLNNIEKHRLLLTVGSSYRSFNPAGYMRQMAADLVAAHPDRWPSGQQITVPDAFFKFADVIPLHVGLQLTAGLPDAEPVQDLQFRFDVAFCEPGIVQAESLLETLGELTSVVEGVVAALTPRLR